MGRKINLREEECKERMGGKRNINIKMFANRDEDFEGKPNRSLKRCRDIDSKEDDEKQGSGEKNEQEFRNLGPASTYV